MSGVVIIGGGQAGASVGLRLRANGYDGNITIVGEESEPPYQRPPLSKKYLTGEHTRDRLYLRPQAVYDELRITLRLGQPVAAVDSNAKRIRLADGLEIPFDHLVFATGARPRLLPEGLTKGFDNIFPFRTFEDTSRLQSEMQPGRRLLVIGGGYIGLEAAAVARQLGLGVTLVEQAPRILQRVASAETAAYFRQLHAGRGVHILEGTKLEGFSRSGSGESLAIIEGREPSPFDLAIVGIGVIPNDEIARSAGVECENGIVVDEHGRTSVPGIYAAGDCTSFPYQGGRLRLESVQNAIAQGELVADAITGRFDKPYAPVPWFWSDQYSTKLQIAGLNAGYDRVIVRPGAKEESLSVWYLRDGAFIAVDAINEPRSYMMGKKWLETGVQPDPVILADAGADLKQAS